MALPEFHCVNDALLNCWNSTFSIPSDIITEAAPTLLRKIPENFNNMSLHSKNCVIAYIILFIIGAPSNLSIFITVGREVWKLQLMRSRIKVLIWHLATADLLVCFVVIPIEVFWRLTVQWYGGDLLCRVSQFFRAFGLYLSSMVIICVSLDRFLAIVFPLRVIGGMNRRVKRMLWVAWICAIVFAMPQLVIFRVQGSIFYPEFTQCTSQGYFTSIEKEIVYNLFSLGAMYFTPLLTIVITYAIVLHKIIRKTSAQHRNNLAGRGGSNTLFRNDSASHINRARNRTMLFSMIIVTVFIICWTPYVTMVMWYLIDYESADKLVDPRIREALFVTAVSNSCINPIIYGNYIKQYWRNVTHCACFCKPADSESTVSLSTQRRNQRQLVPYLNCNGQIPIPLKSNFSTQPFRDNSRSCLTTVV